MAFCRAAFQLESALRLGYGSAHRPMNCIMGEGQAAIYMRVDWRCASVFGRSIGTID